MKYCEFCGDQIHIEAVICPKCGHQLEELKTKDEKSNPQNQKIEPPNPVD
jgi:uncharacterized membrane protein YvbJ